jgi:hypothetical protein
MEILIGLASVVVGLLLTTLSVKLAAGWLDAEHSGWGRSLGALLATYVAMAVLAMVAGGIAAALPNVVGIGIAVLAVVAIFVFPILIFARLLGTTKWRATGILIISILVNIGISISIGLVLAMVLGVGLAGMAGLFSMFGFMSGMDDSGVNDAGIDMVSGFEQRMDDGAAFERVEARVGQLCACRDESCLDDVFPDLMDDLNAVTMSSAIISGDELANTRLEDLLTRIDDCQQNIADGQAAPDDEIDDAQTDTGATGGVAGQADPEMMAEPDPALATEAEPEVAPEREPAQAPSPRRRPAEPADAPISYYVLRDINVSDAGLHIGKLIRITLADGRRLSDQLVALENDAAVLKSDRSEGGNLYAIKLSDIARIEVFGR